MSRVAQPEINFIGNGRLRVVTRVDPYRGNGLKLDVHYLPNQGRNVTDPSEYETFDESWFRLYAKVGGEFLRIPCVGVAGWSPACVSFRSGLRPAPGVFAGIDVGVQIGTPLDRWTVLFEVTVSEVLADVYCLLAPLRARSVRERPGSVVVEPAGEEDPWLVVRGLEAGGGLPLDLAVRGRAPEGILWVSGAEFSLTFGRTEEEALRRAAEAEAEVVVGDLPRKKRNAKPVMLFVRTYLDSLRGLTACVREDGQLPAAVYKGYNDCWVRDGVFCALGLLWAGEVEVARRMISYLAREVPVKAGELEENGMLAYAVRAHFVQTGDDSLVREAWERIESGLEEVLADEERFVPDLSLFMSHREGFWERDWLGPAVNLTQNLWMWLGLRAAADLAREVPGLADAEATADWEQIAERVREMSLTSFVHDGRLIARRTLSGAPFLYGKQERRMSVIPERENPFATPVYLDARGEPILLEPDTQVVQAMLWGLVDPRGEVARHTTRTILGLWNQHWDFGGIPRYPIESDPDVETAGPWFFPALFTARALLLQDDWENALRLMDWCVTEGGVNGVWPERIGHLHARNDPDRYHHQALCWPWGEWLMLFMRELCGVRYTKEGIRLEPHVPDRYDGVTLLHVRFREHKYSIALNGHGSRVRRITVDGEEIDGNLLPLRSGTVEVELTPRGS